MSVIFSILGSIIGFYSLILLVRIVLSWFSGMVQGKFIDFLCLITDPYLDWWRRNLNVTVGILDFSALAGFAALSVAQSILINLSRFEKISLGNIIAVVLLSAWNVVSFIIGFYIIVFILCIFAYFSRRNTYGSFWGTINNICQPVVYRINKIFFSKDINNYSKGLIVSCIVFIVIWIAGKIIIPIIAGFISKIPI